MRFKRWIAASLILAGGCATDIGFDVTGGSRADGTVELRCQSDNMHRCVYDYEAMRISAARVCDGWGYTQGAQVLGNIRTVSSDFYHTRYAFTYQCLGRPEIED